MIQLFINVIVDVLSFIINLVLTPINSIISSNIPGVLDFYENLESFLLTIKNVMNWVVSFSGLSSQAIDLLVAYFIFITISNISARPIRLFVSWWDSIVS